MPFLVDIHEGPPVFGEAEEWMERNARKCAEDWGLRLEKGGETVVGMVPIGNSSTYMTIVKLIDSFSHTESMRIVFFSTKSI